MTTGPLAAVAVLLALLLSSFALADSPQRKAALQKLDQKLKQAKIYAALPPGVSILLDADEVPEGGWYMVTVRQVNGPNSGGDPNVSPALAHFYVHESNGTVEWYDVVEDKRRPFADFVTDFSGS